MSGEEALEWGNPMSLTNCPEYFHIAALRFYPRCSPGLVLVHSLMQEYLSLVMIIAT